MQLPIMFDSFFGCLFVFLLFWTFRKLCINMYFLKIVFQDMYVKRKNEIAENCLIDGFEFLKMFTLYP